MGHKKDMGHTDKLTCQMRRDLLQEFPFGLVCLRRDFSGSQKLTSGKKEKRNPDICVCAILCANACKCVEMRAKCVLNACNNACKMRVNACDNDTKINDTNRRREKYECDSALYFIQFRKSPRDQRGKKQKRKRYYRHSGPCKCKFVQWFPKGGENFEINKKKIKK